MKIEFTDEIVIDENTVTDIEVLPLNFVSFVDLWSKVANEARATGKPATALMQRRRISFQTKFMKGKDRLKPTDAHISQLPIRVAKAIIASLDVGEGVAGEMVGDGDGIAVPALYRLGTPIEMIANGKKIEIKELEFQAKIFGDIEDILAADGEPVQTLELLRKVATPLGEGITVTALPSWAVDRMTVADGVSIMRHVLSRFLD